MKFRPLRSGLARSLVALSVSLAVVLSSHAFAISSFAKANSPQQSDSPQTEFRIVAAGATVLAAGVLIQWRTNAAADNLGFNVYRLQSGQRTLVNHALSPGAGFVSPAAQALMPAGYSYSCFDRGGTADSTYYIESVSLLGNKKTHDAISPSKTASEFEQTPETLTAANASTTQATDSFENYYPAAEDQINSPVGALDDQWAIAAQSGLKIGIKKDGWYRVTKAQMATAGFDPTIEIRNLRMFADAQEIAINTSHQSGPFGSSDYIEFFGRGLDLPTTDTRIYYLIAGTTPGKRVRGQNELDEPPVILPPPTATPTPVPVSAPPRLPPSPPSPRPVLRDQIFRSSIPSDPNRWYGSIWLGGPSKRETKDDINTRAVTRQAEVARAYDSPPESFQPDASQPDVSRASRPVGSGSSGVTQPQPATEKTAKRQDFTNATAGTINTTAPKAKTTSSRATSKMRGSLRKRAHSINRKRSKSPKNLKVERSHPMLSAASTPASFEFAAQRKDRGLYFLSLLNGDDENFFGQVVGDPGNPLNQTLVTPNPDLTSAGPAKLEVAMQGVTFVYHQVELKFNGVTLGTVLPPPPGNVFFGHANVVATFDVPVSLLRTANTLTFTPQAGGDTTIIDYTRLTYRHQFRYDNAIGNIHLASLPGEGDTLTVSSKTYTFKGSPATNLEIGIGVDKQTTATNIANRINIDSAATLCTAVSWEADVNLLANTGGVAGNSLTLVVDGFHLTKTLTADLGAQKFSLRGTQSAKVDGFTTPSVLLIDYTDPAAASISRPLSEPSAFGYAINVPLGDPPAKPPRLFYALPEGQFQQPASLTLNQTSTLNLTSNAADFLIVSYKDFIPSVEPLRLARANQGFTAKVVDVEDVYDEFSYGKHGPQAIKDFLAHALAQWATKPRYVVFVGDASYDPRNYFNIGNYDLVPTKLVDATYNETVSDDWLADIQVDPFSLETDDIADVPVGRIPVRTVAEANLIVSKIINYVPPPEPQAALLVADNPGTPPVWDFESGNDNVQALLPASMTVQRVNVRTEPSIAVATANITAGINEGRALVNYSGHGNVNVWGSSSIFLNANAMALTNGMNKLTFVVVMDCLNGYFHDPGLQSLAEAFLKAPNGGAVGAFASSGLTTTFGQRQMELELYRQLYDGQSIAIGDAVKIAKAASGDHDVRATWILFGDPTIKIR
jgi:hypothetical protein